MPRNREIVCANTKKHKILELNQLFIHIYVTGGPLE